MDGRSCLRNTVPTLENIKWAFQVQCQGCKKLLGDKTTVVFLVPLQTRGVWVGMGLCWDSAVHFRYIPPDLPLFIPENNQTEEPTSGKRTW